MAQHKRSNREVLRSALKHKKAADTIVDALAQMDANLTGAQAKVDADTNITWDTDYEATFAVTEDEFNTPSIGQHKRSLREVMRSSFSHKRMANEVADAIEETQVSINGLLVKMDAGAGTLDAVDANWDAFAVEAVDPDSEERGAQHQRSFRKSLRSALSHREAADYVLDTLADLQARTNAMIDSIKAAN